MDERGGVVPQLLGAAVGIVLGSALLFAVVGMMRDDAPAEPEVVAEESPSAPAAPADGDGEASPDPEASSEPEADAEPSPAAETSPEPTPEATEPAEQVDPASVSIQVLDAVGGDGGSAAQVVADELREAGFDVVVVNRAGRNYDVTTVFWSSGQEAGGQQVASTIGAGQAEETPDAVRLSDSVDVHVVVGADRA